MAIKAKSSQNAYAIYQGVLQFDENWKIQNCLKNVDFWPNLHEICGWYGYVKNNINS